MAALNPAQMRQLAHIAERWDKGYGHFTTRQNIQFNWPKLADVPDILEALADVGMHAIQTSGNTIRNVTADHFAGAAADEIEDPRPMAELLRQWSTDHPEFQFLPRKFKIAVTGAPNDRAVTKAHDIGLRMVRDAAGEPGYEVIVGGGLGRTPMIGKVIRDFLPKADLLPYRRGSGQRLEPDRPARQQVQGAHQDHRARARHRGDPRHGRGKVCRDPARVLGHRPADPDRDRGAFRAARLRDPAGCGISRRRGLPTRPSARWADTNLAAHKAPGYAIVSISIKKHGATPGDATSAQMRVMADLAETYGHDELRISHEQNVILPHVHKADLPAVYQALRAADLATANIGLISDIIACPGMDYCALATARSIPIAQEIAHALR